MNKRLLLFSIFGVYALWACDFNKRLDTSGVVQELKERQVKRVNSAQVTTLVDEWGHVIVAKLNQDLVKSIQQKTQIDSLQRLYRVTIQLGSPLKLQAPDLGNKVNQTLDAYQYNAENHLDAIDNIQASDDGEYLYFSSPVVLQDQFKGMKTTDIQALAQATKLDSLAFRKKGDMLGLWLIRFTKKEVIRLVDVKSLQKLQVKIGTEAQEGEKK